MAILDHNTDTGTHAATESPPPATTKLPSGWLAGLRIATGFIFLWAFLDKTFGLGTRPRRRAPGSTAALRPRAS